MTVVARSVAALYVETGGIYFNVPGVDPWDIHRDARSYAGPHPGVYHPPCARWGRYWSGGPSAQVPREKGADGGCFAAAVGAVRAFGGVIEHPEASSAWHAFEINRPPRAGSWVPAGLLSPGYTCCVEQGHYGHRARKATWLYAVDTELPELMWGESESAVRMDEGFHGANERRRAVRTGVCQNMSKKERMATPRPFAELLIGLARSVYARREARADG